MLTKPDPFGMTRQWEAAFVQRACAAYLLVEDKLGLAKQHGCGAFGG
jgi:hypothetical protein